MIIVVNRVVRSLSRIDFDFVVNCMRIHGGFVEFDHINKFGLN